MRITAIHRILTTVVLMLALCPVFAQDRIVKVIDELEKRSDVSTTYSERRTKKKHKLYRTTRVVSFNNDELYRKLEKAFEAERPNSISAVKSNGSRSYRFADEKGTSTFTLTQNSVVMSWRDNSVPDNEDDGSCNFNTGDLRGLEGLADMQFNELKLSDLDELRDWAEAQRQWSSKQREKSKDKKVKKSCSRSSTTSNGRTSTTTTTVVYL
ncbi:MAG: DUF5024 domain-containing protein [Muribaculaceae bacterium]|nr:DUF5024 domain-containing protein [Muribaculaceae bacterium]